MRTLPRLSRRALVTSLLLVLPLGAWRTISELLTLQPESKLWVDGTSTVRSWSCTAADVDAVVEAAPNAIAQVSAGEKGVTGVRVRVEAAKLDCGNGTMNEHMRKALKADASKVIAFTLADYQVSKSADGVAGTLTGTLSLGGVTKTIAIPATGKREGGALRVVGSYPLNMKDYDLKPPTLMFGRIKVGETVTVKFDLLLKS